MLSVVTPSYNAGRWLPATLASVARLSIEHEHVVADGGSTDGTRTILESRNDPTLRWISEPDRGQTHAVNKALAMARGDILMWLNADDELIAPGVERAVRRLEQEPSLDVVYGGLDFADVDGVVRRRYRPAAWSFRRYLFLGDYIPTPTIIFRARRLAEVGPLDERWEDAADYDFYLRLMHRTAVEALPHAHVLFRYHAESKTGRDALKAQDEALQIRLGWARGAFDRTLMIGFDRIKRALL